MSFRVRESGRVWFFCVGLTLVAGTARAQEAPLPALTLPSLIRAVPHAITLEEPALDVRFEAASSTNLQQVESTKRGVLAPLYVSFASLQMLDAHSTIRVVRAGGVEQNPLMRGLADKPTALFALKAGVAASTIALAERLRGHSRLGSIALMAGLNSAYAIIVAHNYRTIR